MARQAASHMSEPAALSRGGCPCALCEAMVQACGGPEAMPGATRLRGFDLPVCEELYDVQLAVRRASEAAKYPSTVPIDVVSSPPLGHRLRVRFALGRGQSSGTVDSEPTSSAPWRYAILARDAVTGVHGHRFDLVSFPAATERINCAMGALLSALESEPNVAKGVFSANFVDTLSKDDLVVALYYRSDSASILDIPGEWERLTLEQTLPTIRESLPAGRITVVARRKGSAPRVVSTDGQLAEPILVERGLFPGKVVHQVEGSFSNPNGEVTRRVNDWLHRTLMEHGVRHADLVELCSGAGNHTVGLSSHFARVVSVEIDRHLVNRARHNVDANRLENVTLICGDMKRLAQLLRKVGWARDPRRSLVALVDPPRSGLDSATAEFLVEMECDYLVYIACGDGLSRNMRDLEAGYQLVRLCFADHFPFTHFLEKIAVFKRRQSPALTVMEDR